MGSAIHAAGCVTCGQGGVFTFIYGNWKTPFMLLAICVLTAIYGNWETFVLLAICVLMSFYGNWDTSIQLRNVYAVGYLSCGQRCEVISIHASYNLGCGHEVESWAQGPT